MKFFYRLPPFIMGIALAIIKFEHKYVGTLNDGSKPFHKVIIDKMTQYRGYKLISYTLGIALALFSVLILISDTYCVDKNPAKDMEYKELTYCWGPLQSAFYNAFGQFFFFLGISLVLLPSFVNTSKILRPLLDSHLWHVMEELTLSAFLL